MLGKVCVCVHIGPTYLCLQHPEITFAVLRRNQAKAPWLVLDKVDQITSLEGLFHNRHALASPAHTKEASVTKAL